MLWKTYTMSNFYPNYVVEFVDEISANVCEAQSAESKADFIHKMSIAQKESRETNYWLKLLIATQEKLEQRLLPLLNESNELTAIITKIIVSTKKNN